LKTSLTTDSSLLEALQQLIPGASNRTLRQMLSQGRVRLNGEICKLASASAGTGDTVEVGGRTASSSRVHGLDIVFEDEHLVVIHKPAGLLTVATQHERERTAYAYLRKYLQESPRKQKVFVVHRLDKFVSGLLVFAKSETVKSGLQALFARHDVQRRYWAVVEGQVENERGTIRSRIAQDRSLRMHSTEDAEAGKHAVTHYRILRRLPGLTCLEITLETGRKNQIRVHLSEMGHPIVGDRSYGSTTDPLGRMGLHAFELGFAHPRLGTPMHFKTEPPPEFRRLFRPKPPPGHKDTKTQ
jgi:23S rRNA pseudouridine1911/1915/1917 synthase